MNWLYERCKMPRFVWFGVLAIFLAIAFQIVRARNLLIDLNDRTLHVAQAEREVCDRHDAATERERQVDAALNDALARLERLEREAIRPEERDVFSAAQMKIREDVFPVRRRPSFEASNR